MSPFLTHTLAGLAIATASTLLGCGPHCEASTCPEPVALHELCGKPGACTLGGAPTVCVSGSCDVLEPERGEHAVFSLGAVSLDRTRALHLSYGNGGGSSGPDAVWPDAKKAIVLLDGVPGHPRTVRGEYNSIDVFVWDPFPSAPASLDFSYEDGNQPIEVLMNFLDANCTADTEGCEG